MSIQMRFLGTGGSFGCPIIGCDCPSCVSIEPRDQRLRSSILLEWEGTRILVDAGPDLRTQCLREGIVQLDEVWFTHAHADHTNGVDDLRAFCRQGPLVVRGSETTLSETRQRYPYAFRTEYDGSGVSHPLLAPTIVDGPFTVGGREIVPVPVRHGPFPCTGFRIGDFAYVTDVSEIPAESMDLLRGLKVLVLSALREETHVTHLSFDQATEIVRRLEPERVWFTHFAHRTTHAQLEGRFPSNCAPAYDGLRLEVG